jgi:hypothetical protein
VEIRFGRGTTVGFVTFSAGPASALLTRLAVERPPVEWPVRLSVWAGVKPAQDKKANTSR